MEKLSVEKRTEVSKMSTERLCAKLIKSGYDEDEVFEMDRGELLSTYDEYLLTPTLPKSPEKAEGGTSAEELELKRQKEERLQQELELRKEELQMQREMRKRELEFQKEKQEKEEERRQGKLEMRRQEREEDLDRQRQRDELELQRREENRRRDRENEIREMELQRQRAKDEAERKRQESMAGQTRFYGDALKHSLPKMGLDPTEFPSYFASVENLFSLYEVPPQLQSKLLIPMLNERSKSLLAKLPK